MSKDNNWSWPVGGDGRSGGWPVEVKNEILGEELGGLLALINAGYGRPENYGRLAGLMAIVAGVDLEQAQMMLEAIEVPPDRRV